MNRAELVGETMRAALNELATVAPGWLRNVVPNEWFERYAHRVEEFRLPKSKTAREAYLLTVGGVAWVWWTPKRLSYHAQPERCSHAKESSPIS
jgi:hypothetical protein